MLSNDKDSNSFISFSDSLEHMKCKTVKPDIYTSSDRKIIKIITHNIYIYIYIYIYIRCKYISLNKHESNHACENRTHT
jgi:hypothetical protein